MNYYTFVAYQKKNPLTQIQTRRTQCSEKYVCYRTISTAGAQNRNRKNRK